MTVRLFTNPMEWAPDADMEARHAGSTNPLSACFVRLTCSRHIVGELPRRDPVTSWRRAEHGRGRDIRRTQRRDEGRSLGGNRYGAFSRSKTESIARLLFDNKQHVPWPRIGIIAFGCGLYCSR